MKPTRGQQLAAYATLISIVSLNLAPTSWSRDKEADQRLRDAEEAMDRPLVGITAAQVRLMIEQYYDDFQAREERVRVQREAEAAKAEAVQRAALIEAAAARRAWLAAHTPAAQPTAVPAAQPTAVPAAQPTAVPAAQPTAVPAAQPTGSPAGEAIDPLGVDQLRARTGERIDLVKKDRERVSRVMSRMSDNLLFRQLIEEILDTYKDDPSKRNAIEPLIDEIATRVAPELAKYSENNRVLRSAMVAGDTVIRALGWAFMVAGLTRGRLTRTQTERAATSIWTNLSQAWRDSRGLTETSKRLLVTLLERANANRVRVGEAIQANRGFYYGGVAVVAAGWGIHKAVDEYWMEVKCDAAQLLKLRQAEIIEETHDNLLRIEYRLQSITPQELSADPAAVRTEINELLKGTDGYQKALERFWNLYPVFNAGCVDVSDAGDFISIINAPEHPHVHRVCQSRATSTIARIKLLAEDRLIDIRQINMGRGSQSGPTGGPVAPAPAQAPQQQQKK